MPRRKELCCIPDLINSIPIFEQTAYAPGECDYLADGTCRYTHGLQIIVEAGVYKRAIKNIIKTITSNCAESLRYWSTNSEIMNFADSTWSPLFTVLFFENIEFVFPIPRNISREIEKAIKEHVPKTQKHISVNLKSLTIIPEAICFFPENEYLKALGKFKYYFGEIQLLIDEKEQITLDTPKEIKKLHTGMFKDTRSVLRLKGHELL